jgi:dihydrofolate reductase
MKKSNTVDKEGEKPRISIVVALGRDGKHNHVIGKNNKLLWHIPDDLKRFKILTLNHPVIMGRKTFESILAILKKPLPQRTNIVITRDPKWSYPGVITTHSLEEALFKARGLDRREVFIGGGTQIYEQALPFVDRLYLTLIDDEKEGDAYFPRYENNFTNVVSEESRESNGLKYRWLTIERV